MRSIQLQLGNVINLQFEINSLKLEKLIHLQNSHKTLCHINCNMSLFLPSTYIHRECHVQVFIQIEVDHIKHLQS